MENLQRFVDSLRWNDDGTRYFDDQMTREEVIGKQEDKNLDNIGVLYRDESDQEDDCNRDESYDCCEENWTDEDQQYVNETFVELGSVGLCGVLWGQLDF